MSQNTTPNSGRTYWQSLDHLAETPDVQKLLANEFQNYSPSEIASMPRRRFLTLMGASMALSGLTLTGCRRWPKEHLAPYTFTTADRVPGIPEFYATTMELGGVAKPVLAKAYDGRPIKIEGNPSHPASATWNGKHGSADQFAQASILEMYDPDRSRFVIDRSQNDSPRQSNYDEFFKTFGGYLATNCPGGAGFYILSEATESPSVADMKARLLAKMPQTKWFEYEALSNDNEVFGVKQATGKSGRSVLKLENAEAIVSLDSDFLGLHLSQTRYANDFARGRKSADLHGRMSRLYVAESTFSLTGSNADERLPVKPSKIESLAAALAAAVGVAGITAPALEENEREFIAAAAKDLKAAGGKAVVTVGASASQATHVLAYLINASLGAINSTVTYVQLPDRAAPHATTLTALGQEIRAGAVKALWIVGGNPAFDAPADADFASALKTLAVSAHLSYYMNETSLACKWHTPRAHYLECWGDARAWDGTIATAQPLIEPLFGGKSTIEVIAKLIGDESDGQAIVRRTHGANNDVAWKQTIQAGVVVNSAYPAIAGAAGAMPQLGSPVSGKFEVRFTGSYSLYDGRFGNLGWLLELPDPLTKLTWDNAALIAKKDADELGVTNGNMLTITVGGRKLDVPAYILPGQPRGVVTLPLGFGRSNAGSVGGLEAAGVKPCGFNTYALRGSDSFHAAAAEVAKATGTYKLISTVDHHLMIDEVGFQGREKRVGKKHESGRIIRESTVTAFVGSGKKSDVFAYPGSHGAASRLQIYANPNPTNTPPVDPGAPDRFNAPHAWGMAIDMSACIGCGACAVACQAENNIPVVGKEMVEINREMNWLRIDRYFKGDRDDDNPQVVYQPMMCVQCENAPCEQVCPVAATVHDTEGLNTMVYNRCIGTRYCSNNCPYKVRRFNYYDYHATGARSGRYRLPYLNWPDQQQRTDIDELLWMQFNPEVTVRMRGVMEKCNYCTQRIASAKITARNEWKQGKRESDLVRDGDIVTACQEACPTEAIIFGNLNDKGSQVRAWQENNRAYAVLDDLNTRPRTKYLAKLRNPVKEPAPAKEEHHG